MTEKAHVAIALGALFISILACKHTYTAPGSAADASVDVAEEREIAPTGSCKPDVGNSLCALGDKAAWCKPRLVRTGPKSSRWEGDWVSFTCPDCRKESQYAHIQCGDYAAGDPCDTSIADAICTRDKLAAYHCDADTKTWKIDACPGGCELAPTTRFVRCKE